MKKIIDLFLLKYSTLLDKFEFFKHIGKDTNFVRVYVIEDLIQGEMIKNTLERNGIPFIIENYRETAYDGLFIPQKGYGAVIVPEEYFKIASSLIKELIDVYQI